MYGASRTEAFALAEAAALPSFPSAPTLPEQMSCLAGRANLTALEATNLTALALGRQPLPGETALLAALPSPATQRPCLDTVRGGRSGEKFIGQFATETQFYSSEDSYSYIITVSILSPSKRCLRHFFSRL